MILPGNSRQTIIDALQGLTEAPHIAGSKVVNDLEDAGFRVVDYGELKGVLEGLLGLIDDRDPIGITQTADSVILAKALLEVLKPLGKD